MNSGRLPWLAAFVIVTLMIVCVASAPRGEMVVDFEGTDVASAVDAFQAIAPVGSQSLVTAPAHRGTLFLDQLPPRSRLTTPEVFRPPQART